jgi:hypothetical protein
MDVLISFSIHLFENRWYISLNPLKMLEIQILLLNQPKPIKRAGVEYPGVKEPMVM